MCNHFNAHACMLAAETQEMRNEDRDVCIYLGNARRQVSVRFYHSETLRCSSALFKIHHSSTGLFDMQPFSPTQQACWRWSPVWKHGSSVTVSLSRLDNKPQHFLQYRPECVWKLSGTENWILTAAFFTRLIRNIMSQIENFATLVIFYTSFYW